MCVTVSLGRGLASLPSAPRTGASELLTPTFGRNRANLAFMSLPSRTARRARAVSICGAAPSARSTQVGRSSRSSFGASSARATAASATTSPTTIRIGAHYIPRAYPRTTGHRAL